MDMPLEHPVISQYSIFGEQLLMEIPFPPGELMKQSIIDTADEAMVNLAFCNLQDLTVPLLPVLYVTLGWFFTELRLQLVNWQLPLLETVI
jgi:hypothetical protein